MMMIIITVIMVTMITNSKGPVLVWPSLQLLHQMQLTSRPALSGKKSPTVHCTPLILDEQCWEDVKKYLPLLSFIPSGMGMSISLMVENGGPAMEWTQGLNQSKNLLFNVCTLLSSIVLATRIYWTWISKNITKDESSTVGNLLVMFWVSLLPVLCLSCLCLSYLRSPCLCLSCLRSPCLCLSCLRSPCLCLSCLRSPCLCLSCFFCLSNLVSVLVSALCLLCISSVSHVYLLWFSFVFPLYLLCISVVPPLYLLCMSLNLLCISFVSVSSEHSKLYDAVSGWV